MIDSDLVKSTDMYFKATLQRSNASMTVHVVLSPDYPSTSPLLVLSVLWPSVIDIPHTALNDDAVRVSIEQ